MPWGYAASAVGSYLGSKGKGGSASTTQQVDPRIANILFGQDNNGILNKFQGYLDQPYGDTNQKVAGVSDAYLQGNYEADVNRLRNANYHLLEGNAAPTIGAAVANAAQINAPSQNALNLSPAYQNFIYGNAAENPYLTKSLQSGINQSNQAFQTQLGDITQNLQRNILPGIRGNAIASGQFGSSRQGIAEGNALSDLNRQATNAAQQLGLANISATTGAQANAFNQGQDRSLSALQGLSGQQYNTALSQAQLNQQAELANAAARQAADNTNVNAGLQTQAQNNAANIAAQSGLQSLLGLNQQNVTNANNYGINRAQQVAGLLSPFIGVNSSTISPTYQNRAAGALGGALGGLSLYNQLSGIGNGSGSSGYGGFGDLFGSGSGGTLGSSAVF